jgi:hypothetical protein
MNSLSLRNTHQFKKEKMKQGALIATKEKNPSVE